MERVFDFSDSGRYDELYVPDHTQEALENYFLRGYSPGGFVTAVLAGDLFRAVSSADHENRKYIYSIARWISYNAPAGSWGSHNAVDSWIQDVDGRRTTFTDRVEKKLVWQTLTR